MNSESHKTNHGRKLIVLVPVKDESWIISHFLKATSLWADVIIIADQNSTDGTREIVSQFPKAIMIENNSTELDEDYRDRLLVDKAREIAGKGNILFRIDADEILTPCFDSVEWNNMLSSEPGTVWFFHWVNLLPNFKKYWKSESLVFGAFIDDGRPFSGHSFLHSRDLFDFHCDRKKVFNECLLMHYQFADWNRMNSKHRFYQCFEHIKFPEKSAIDIFRTYHWMYNPALPVKPLPNSWIYKYKQLGIDIKDIKYDSSYRWNQIIKKYINEYSSCYFDNFDTNDNNQSSPNNYRLTLKGKPLLSKLLLFYLKSTTNAYNSHTNHLFRYIIVKTDVLLKKRFKL